MLFITLEIRIGYKSINGIVFKTWVNKEGDLGVEKKKFQCFY